MKERKIKYIKKNQEIFQTYNKLSFMITKEVENVSKLKIYVLSFFKTYKILKTNILKLRGSNYFYRLSKNERVN